MKEKLGELYFKHCFKIMIGGFSLCAIGCLIFIAVKPPDIVLRKISFSTVIAGFAFYIIGRVGIILNQRRARKRREALPVDDNEEKDDA
jgi:hypothetical protein